MTKTISKKKNSALLIIATLALTACGKNFAGNYRGTQTTYQSYGTMTGQPSTSTTTATQGYTQILAMTLTDNGNSVTGTFTAGSQTGNIQGTIGGNGLQNVILTMGTSTYNNQQSGSYTYGYQPYTTTGYGCSGIFMGNLDFSNNRLSGTLTTQANMSGSTCGTSSVAIDVQK